MNDKEFVLVSQGIEIYRTKSQENAVNMVKEYNDEYFDYLQKCYDNYERPADNYVDLEIEYSNEKEKDEEIKRLQKENEELKKIQCTFLGTGCKREIERLKEDNEYLNKVNIELSTEKNRLNNIINELEKWLKEQRDYYYENYYYSDFNAYGSKCDDVLDKLQELKGSDKE